MAETISTRCCIAGGGPAGMMLGFLLARMGVDVCVLEKHADFLRDFRGDTIHPSTLDLMYELGILDEFLKRPHQQVTELAAQVGPDLAAVADFTHLPTHCKFMVLMPQWDFLDFIKEHAQRYPNFHLKLLAEVTGLLEADGKVVGVRAKTPDGELEVHAPLTIGADGRRSIVRTSAGLQVIDVGAPMDVLWMRLSRKPTDPGQTLGHVDHGKFIILLNREDYWQCALVIPKGEFDSIRQRGLPSFRQELAAHEPFLRDRVEELRDWKDVSLLTVTVDHLAKWSRPGLLCIGDAAHAMSPIGGVGINLAIQDAVATANILGPTLVYKGPSENELEVVQRRRHFPTWATQKLQVAIQNTVVRAALASDKPLTLPFPLKLMNRYPFLRRIPARIVGVGFRPEHIRTPGTASNG